jgi:hypothetical protein
MDTMLSFWLDEPIYLAGDVVPAGIYHEIGTESTVCVEQGGRLPPAMGSALSAYVIVRNTAIREASAHVVRRGAGDSPDRGTEGVKR